MLNILFVDDEQRLLDGLARMLRPHQQSWAMTFALGGVNGIAQLATGQFDIVICDMRMPVVDGLTVLRYARDHSPHTVRLALSGQTDLDVMTQSAAIVHQFLSKPCSPNTLRDVIERISNLQSLLRSPVLQSMVGQMSDLPSLPQTYQRFAEAVENPDTSIREIVRIVEQDVALSARCLQFASSAYFGTGRRLDTLDQAVACVGVSTLRAMVLSSTVFSSLTSNGLLTHAELECFERHAIAVATLARMLLDDEAFSQQAFMAGMLHDVGRLIMATHRTDPLVAADSTDPAEIDPADAEVMHAEVGAYLLGLWSLPHTIVEAVALHHRPDRISADGLDVAGAVYVANALLHEHRIAADPVRPAAAPELIAYLESIGSAGRLPELRVTAASVLGVECE